MGYPPKLNPKFHLHVFSASQIQEALLCERKWAFDKIDRLKRVSHPSTELGSAVHDVLENYLKKAVPIDTSQLTGKIAVTSLEHLPYPMTSGLSVENWFVRKRNLTGVNNPNDPTYWGKKDAAIAPGVMSEIPIVWDHKTCGSFSFMPDEQELKQGIQAGIYGWDSMEESGADSADLRWNYMRTQGSKKCIPVRVIIHKEEAEEIMVKADTTAKRLIVLKNELKKGEAIKATPNYASCSAYGGCPRREICGTDSTQFFLENIIPKSEKGKKDTMENKTSSTLLADLRNRKKKKTSASKEKEKIKAIAEDKKQTKDIVNPPDRELTPPPPSPPAKKMDKGGRSYYLQPRWNTAAWEWQFSEESSSEPKVTEIKKPNTNEFTLDMIAELIAEKVKEKLK